MGCDAYDLKRSVDEGDGWGILAGVIGFFPFGDVAKLPKQGRRIAGAANGCTRCSLAGTDVLMADGSTKDIEDVEVGDKVLATDPETGETKARKVTRLIITEDDKHFNKLFIATDSGMETLTATYEHPFWSPSEDRWVEAGDLKPGMTLLTDDGETVIVTAHKPFTKHARTYNLTVNDLHTYYVLAGQTQRSSFTTATALHSPTEISGMDHSMLEGRRLRPWRPSGWPETPCTWTD